MPNGVHKRSEFDASTRVMESDLLQVPTDKSRLFLVAAVVAAIVLAFDASLFVLHQRRAARPPATPTAPEPLPRYMLLPLGTPPPAVEATDAEKAAPTSAPSTNAVVAAVLPDSTQPVVHGHRHSHHRHASH